MFNQAAKSYSVSELELSGILINVLAFKHILNGTNFEIYIDHKALTHILKSPAEPPTMRMKRILEKLSDYDFKLGYVKRRDLVVSDFLSHQPVNTHDTDTLIPIAFHTEEEGLLHCIEGEAIKVIEEEEVMCKVKDFACPATTPNRPITRALAKKENITIPNLWETKSRSISTRKK